MAFEVFKERVYALVNKSNVGAKDDEIISVRFHNDTEKGRFFANCSDGTTIIGNSLTAKVAVRFGSGHQAYASI